MSSPLRRASAGFVAVVLAFGLTAAACGGSSDEEASEETTTEEVATDSETANEVTESQAIDTLSAEELLEKGLSTTLQDPTKKQAICSASADQQYSAVIKAFVAQNFPEDAVKAKLTEEKVGEYFAAQCAQ